MKASGGKINSKKGHIYVWNTSARTSQKITSVLQFPLQENWTSFKYLGIPICLKNISSWDWTPLLEKIKSNFSLRGTQWLNPAGRVVLIKAIFSALPIF